MYPRRLLVCKKFQTGKRLHVRVQCHGRLILLLFASCQVTPAHAQKESNTAYEAVFKGGKEGDTTLWYDRGKYAFQSRDRISICDDAHPPARWTVELKTKTAELGFHFVILQLIQLIKKDGLDATARKIHVDRSLLAHFARSYKSYVPRNLDHTLQRVNVSDPGFRTAFERTGVEIVAERRCDRYISTTVPEHKLWVDTSSGYVLKERNVYPSGNPRIPQIRYAREVSRFRILSSVEVVHLQVPPGITAVVPHLLVDFALPAGVKQQLMTGDRRNLGFDLKQLLMADEQNGRLLRRAQKAKKR